jgi:MFS family permease
MNKAPQNNGGPDEGSPRSTVGWMNRTVLGAGITSALGDFSYETANVILPGFLAVLGIPPAALGAIEGVADAISSFTKLGSGYIADRLGHRKSLVVVGYALTASMQVLIALAVGWPLILIARIIGWFGKGVRGPLRDAILAESITQETRGRAFGFHRAADTVGAVLGPLLGIALLSWFQDWFVADSDQPFRYVFWLAVIPGVLSVVSFALLVKDDRTQPNPKLRIWTALTTLPAGFRRYLGAVGIFGMGDFAHTLLILAGTQLLTVRFGVVHAAQIAGLMYVGRNVVQALASFPIGALADRIGHRQVLVVGYGLGVVMSGLLVLAFTLEMDSIILLAVIFALAGLYIAVQDALEASMTAELVPLEIRNVSYGMLGSVNGVGDFVSSVVVGFLWSAVSPEIGFSFATIVMFAGTVAMARLRTLQLNDQGSGVASAE